MADNKKISKIKLPDGTTYDIRDANAGSAIVFDGVYDATTNKAATVSTVTDKINTLDGSITGSAGTGKTLSAFSQIDGKVSATFSNISITKSQVSDFPTLGTAAAADTTTSITDGSTDLPTAGTVYTYVNDQIAASDAMKYKGTIGTGGTLSDLPTNKYKIGWTYRVATAGTYAGVACEVGDMIIAWKNGPSSGSTVINSDWTIIQTNIDGAVVGPSSATANHVAVFDGTTGKLIKDGTYTINKSVPSDAEFTDTTYTATKGSQSVTAGSAASFTQGTFSAGTLPSIDTSKFSGGSFTSGSFSQGSLPTLNMSVSNKILSITFGQGSLPTHGIDSFTGASIGSGFFSQGTLPSHSSDSFTTNVPTSVSLQTSVVTDVTAD